MRAKETVDGNRGGEDEEKRNLEIVQKLIDKYNQIVEDKFKEKEKELLTRTLLREKGYNSGLYKLYEAINKIE